MTAVEDSNPKTSSSLLRQGRRCDRRQASTTMSTRSKKGAQPRKGVRGHCCFHFTPREATKRARPAPPRLTRASAQKSEPPPSRSVRHATLAAGESPQRRGRDNALVHRVRRPSHKAHTQPLTTKPSLKDTFIGSNKKNRFPPSELVEPASCGEKNSTPRRRDGVDILPRVVPRRPFGQIYPGDLSVKYDGTD